MRPINQKIDEPEVWLTSDPSALDPEAYHERLQDLAERLRSIISGHVPPKLLLEAMEIVRSGISAELMTSIVENLRDNANTSDIFAGFSPYEL